VPGPVSKALGRTAERVPGLRRIPILKLLAVAELMVIARAHIAKLEPAEWRRMAELIRLGRGRPSNLSARQRRELRSLIEKVEPRAFAAEAIDKFSPVPIPDRLLYGSSGRDKRAR
jgi:hypothetical protein